MFSRKGLSREENLALNMLESNLPSVKSNLMLNPKELSLEHVSTQGSTIFYNDHLKTSHIPREKHWKWNRSKGIVQISDASNQVFVTFYKLNARIIPPGMKAPPYKIWVFNIYSIEDSKKFGFLWCQKGNIPSLDDRFLHELSFLHQFVTIDTALELGWIDGYLI